MSAAYEVKGTLRLKPGVPLVTMCDDRLTFYPHGEMRRIRGTYTDGDNYDYPELADYLALGQPPPGEKAREKWGPITTEAGPRRMAYVQDWPLGNHMVRVDSRTGVAYTYGWGNIPSPDELSPWRRGVLR